MNLTKSDDNLTMTVSGNPGFQRGDLIVVSGFANNFANGLYKVQRSRGSLLITQPANLWDYVRYFASKVGMWVRWHWHGFIDRCLDVIWVLRDLWRKDG